MEAPAHPSNLYRTIHDQPRIVRDVLGRCRPPTSAAAEILQRSRRVLLAGTGTSSHAAMVGQYMLRAAGVEAWALTHQELALYPPPLSSGDALVTISHRGNKKYGEQCIELARRSGVPVIGLTGLDSPMQGTDLTIATAPQETSSTHTASYTANLAALAMIASEFRTGPSEALAHALPQLPSQLEEVLAREAEIAPVADLLAQCGRVAYAGAGPNRATASEGALKVKESSYLVAEGFELESLLHGGLQALRAGDLGVVAVHDGPSVERVADLARALSILQAHRWIVGDRASLSRIAERVGPDTLAHELEVPSVPEPLSPLLNVIPLQLLACFTAERRGTNPDSFREDDPTFARISASYRL